MKWFKKQNKNVFEPGHIFVVGAGTYGGDYLVLIEQTLKDFIFLVLPEMQKRVIDRETFQRGIDNKVVECIEKLPAYAFNACKIQFEGINN